MRYADQLTKGNRNNVQTLEVIWNLYQAFGHYPKILHRRKNLKNTAQATKMGKILLKDW